MTVLPQSAPRSSRPFGVGFDAGGTLFFVEMTGHRVRKIGRDGLVKSIAGTGSVGDRGDGGPAINAALNGPHSLAVAKSGEIFVCDTWNNRVRKIDPRSGVITNFAGTGRKGFAGDGGPAAEADFGGIYCLALDEANQSLYLADLDNRRIRKIDMKTRVVSTVAGNGKKGVPADGAVANSRPWSIPERWPSIPAATSISWSDQGTPFGSSIDPGGFAPWPVPANPVTRVTVAMRGERG